MKVNVEIDCTPDEARRFMGLPDVSKANEVYVERLTKAMQGITSLDQLKDFAQNLAPMGQMGLKLFQNMMSSGAAFTEAATGAGKSRRKT